MAFAGLSVFLNASAQLVVNNTTLTPTQLVQNVLVGGGVTVSNVTFNGASGNTLTNQAGSFNGTTTNLGLNGGVILASGDAQAAVGPNGSGSFSLGPPQNLAGTDPDLQAITPNLIYDQAVLEFDFVPIGDSISFRYVFASEEYNEYVCGSVNDAFGFFISGPGIAGPYTNGAANIALIPGTNTPVSINTVNLGVAGGSGIATNCSNIDPNWASYNVYYAGTNTQNSVQYDGWTVVLTARAAVQCGETYHIKLAIADAGDGVWDSGVFLEAGSLTSVGVDVTVTTVTGDSTIVEGCADAIFTFTRPDTTTDLTIDFDISGNANNGTDYTFIADSVYFPIGEDSVQLIVTPLQDGITEGMDTLVITVYTITPCGDTIPKTATLYIVDPTPLIANAGTDQSITCPGQNVNLNGSATGGNGTLTYTWAGQPPGQNTTVNPLVTTSYQISVTDVCGQTDLDSVTVTVPVIATWNYTTGSDPVVCSGDPSDLFISVAGGGFPPYTYAWNNGDTDTNTTVNPIVTTTYNVTVTDNCGLDTTVTITVNVPVYPPLIISIDDAQLCLGESLFVIPNVTGGAGSNTYAWNGPAGVTFNINQTNGQTAFDGPVDGVYIVSVTDLCGTIDADTANYTFVGCEITIPNVISPNGDGSNDTWHLVNLEYHPNTTVQIFNRWGVLVYESSNYQNNWSADGLSDGTYFYIVVPVREGYGPYNGTVTVTGNK